MSNIMAAIGIEQLKRFPLYAKKRQQLAIQYDQLFTDHSSIQPLPRDYKTVVPHIYVVRIHGMKNRKEIQQKMLEKGVQVGYHYQPNHLLSFYKNDKARPLSVTESVFPEIMSLPLHPDLSNNNVEYVADELSKIIK